MSTTKTKDDKLLLSVEFVEESNEWTLTFRSPLGVVVNKFVINEEVSELTPNRHRVVESINKLIDINTIHSTKIMKSGLELITLRSVDPLTPNIMTCTTIANDERAILTYKRLVTEVGDNSN